MGETEYSEALKLGKKEYRARIAKGQFPYLPVLDEILSDADSCNCDQKDSKAVG